MIWSHRGPPARCRRRAAAGARPASPGHPRRCCGTRTSRRRARRCACRRPPRYPPTAPRRAFLAFYRAPHRHVPVARLVLWRARGAAEHLDVAAGAQFASATGARLGRPAERLPEVRQRAASAEHAPQFGSALELVAPARARQAHASAGPGVLVTGRPSRRAPTRPPAAARLGRAPRVHLWRCTLGGPIRCIQARWALRRARCVPV